MRIFQKRDCQEDWTAFTGYWLTGLPFSSLGRGADFAIGKLPPLQLRLVGFRMTKLLMWMLPYENDKSESFLNKAFSGIGLLWSFLSLKLHFFSPKCLTDAWQTHLALTRAILSVLAIQLNPSESLLFFSGVKCPLADTSPLIQIYCRKRKEEHEEKDEGQK